MAGYVWNGSWRQLTSGWVWSGSVWKQINSGWMWDGTGWRQIFSSGTFQPEIRDGSGNVIYNRSVGIALVGYRGSNVAGTYNYQWQYAATSNPDTYGWAAQTGAATNGTLTGTTLTTNYTTDASDLNVIKDPTRDYSLYMRFRVTKGTEVQYSQRVRIVKRAPIASGIQTTSGARAYNNFVTTYNPILKNPYYNGDRLVFWSSSDWTATTTLTGDTSPDYYIFTYTTGSGVTVKDSRTTDPGNPQTPTNASKYFTVTGDLNSPVVVEIVAHTSHPNSPTTAPIITTRNVSDGTLLAPTNLSLQRYTIGTGQIIGTWNESDGGDETKAINYQWYLYRNGSQVSSGIASGGAGPLTRTILYTPTLDGTYYFTVYAYQTVGPSSPVATSSDLVLEYPAAFTYSIVNETSTRATSPGTFSVNAFAENTTTSNRYEVSWTAASGAEEYIEDWYRPSGINSLGYSVGTATSDYWPIFDSGNHRLVVTAVNKDTQYLYVKWTKPAGTSAKGYKIQYYIVSNGIGSNYTSWVGDVTEKLVTIVNTNVTYVSVTGVTAYDEDVSGGSAIGLSKAGTSSGGSVLSSSGLFQTSSSQAERTQYLDYIISSAGTLSVSGDAEPGQSLSYSYTGTWTPAVTTTGWSLTRTWGITRNVTGLPDTFNKGTAATASVGTGDIGEYLIIRVVAKYKDQTSSTVYGYSEVVVPAPPAFTVTNNYNLTFSISSVTSSGAGYYFGSYTTSGTIAETAIASTYTSPALTAGTKTVTLYGRARKTMNGIQEIFDGRRSTAKDVTVSELGAFSWTVADATATPARPDAFTPYWDVTTTTPIRYDWNDTADTTSWQSSITGGPEVDRTNDVTASNDYWSTTSGRTYTVSVYSKNTNGIVRVSWNASDGAGSYKVNYTKSGVTTTSAALTGTSYDISSTTGTPVTVNSVTAYSKTDGTGTSKTGTAPATKSITPATTTSASRDATATAPVAPSTPTGLTISYVSASQTWNLSWGASTNATGYAVEYQYATSQSGAGATGSTLTGTSTNSYTIPARTGYIWARARVQGSNSTSGLVSSQTAWTSWT